MNQAIIFSKLSAIDHLKAQTLIKTVGAGIVGEWIDQNSRHQRVSKT
jgi:hypothetical protein